MTTITPIPETIPLRGGFNPITSGLSKRLSCRTKGWYGEWKKNYRKECNERARRGNHTLIRARRGLVGSCTPRPTSRRKVTMIWCQDRSVRGSRFFILSCCSRPIMLWWPALLWLRGRVALIWFYFLYGEFFGCEGLDWVEEFEEKKTISYEVLGDYKYRDFIFCYLFFDLKKKVVEQRCWILFEYSIVFFPKSAVSENHKLDNW